jgi:hypothetical protein
VRLSERTNEYFIKLLGQWLVSDSVASFFVFDLGGFEFLLDTIGLGGETDIASLAAARRKSSIVECPEKKAPITVVEEEEKSVVPQPTDDALDLGGSDLGAYLEQTILEFQAAQKGFFTEVHPAASST